MTSEEERQIGPVRPQDRALIEAALGLFEGQIVDVRRNAGAESSVKLEQQELPLE